MSFPRGIPPLGPTASHSLPPFHEFHSNSPLKISRRREAGGEKSPAQVPALHVSCQQGLAPAVEELLRHPHIQVNIANEDGHTPLHIACFNKNPEVVRLLLKDPRVDVNMPDEDGRTAFWWACFHGKLGLIHLFLTSHRLLDLDQRGLHLGKWTNPPEILRELGNHYLAEELRQYQAHPGRKRHELNVDKRNRGAMTAELFALVVLHCDSYLRVSRLEAGDKEGRAAKRFYGILGRIPIEIQMLVCNRVFGLARDLVPFLESEDAFSFIIHWFDE